MLRAMDPQADDPQLGKTLETLKQMRLGPMELRRAESYLRGESSDTALRAFGTHDMTRLSPTLQRAAWSIFKEYHAQKRYAEMSRYFKLLYALYGSFLAECMYDHPMFQSVAESGDLQADSSITLTVYARYMVPKVYMRSGQAAGRRYLQASDLESLARLIRYDLQAVRRALKEYRERSMDVKMVLYTLYFYLRSSRVVLNAGQSIWDSTHALRSQRSASGGMWMLNVKKRAADKMVTPSLIGPPELDSADKALLREYENVMVSALGQIFRPNGSGDRTFRDIQNRIRRGEFPRSLLPQLRGRAVDHAVFLLIACCAYANYRISGQLRGVVAVCAAADPEETLWVVHHMREFAGIEDGLDETFGIPVRYLVGWVMGWVEDDFAYRSVADMDTVNALFCSQFRKYPDAYLAIWKKADYFVAHVMARAIRAQDWGVYEREVLSASAGRRQQVIDLLTAAGSSLPVCKDYLEGRRDLSALRALRIQLGGGYKGEHNARKALEWYDETYRDEDFYARCMAYMALRGCDDFFRYVEYIYLKQEHETSPEEMTRRTFQGLARAGAELEQQAHIACVLVSDTYGDDRKGEILSCCVSVFAQYLDERPWETRDALTGEGSWGRYLALLVYAREDMRDEVLAYRSDRSRLVRGGLERILAERPQWREQMGQKAAKQIDSDEQKEVDAAMLRANVQDGKVMDVLEALRLTGQEQEVAEKYLKGETGEDSLAALPFRDMEALPQEKAQEFTTLFQSYLKRKCYEEAGRLFELVYAVGGSSCQVCFQHMMDELCMRICDGSVRADRSKVLAAMARKAVGSQHYLNSFMFTFNRIIMGQPDLGIVLRAYREDRASYSHGKLLLLTQYFYLRCSSKELERGAKLQKQKNSLTCPLDLGRTLMDGEDKALLEEYEEMLTGLLGAMFVPNASGDMQIREIQRRIRQGGLTQNALTCVRGRTVSDLLFTLLGGCAYINYMLSERLRSVVMVCSAVNARKMLEVIAWMDVRKEIGHVSGEMEELFGIPNRESIFWAVQMQTGLSYRWATDAQGLEKLLHQQFRLHREDFLACYRSADYQAANVLAEIIRQEDPALYKQEVLSQGDAQRERVIDLLTDKQPHAREAKEYLAGRADLASLYALNIQQSSRYQGHREKLALDQYCKTYQDEDLYCRCMAYMAMLACGYFFTAYLFDKKGVLDEQELEHIFRGLDRAGTDLAAQLGVMTLMVDSSYLDSKKQAVTDGCIPIFRQYLAERTQEMEKAFSEADAYGRYFALRVYGSQGKVRITEENRDSCAAAQEEFSKGRDAWREQILSYSQDSSKLVKQELEQMLTERSGWREQICAMLSSKKAAERELGIRVLARWNTEQDRAALQGLYESEKSAKIRALLDTALGHGTQAEKDGAAEGGNTALTREDLVKDLHKGGKKRSLAWAYETPFSPVRTKGGEQATEEYLQALLLCYCSMTKPGINADAALLAEDLEPQGLAVYVGELFDKWMSAGAESKKRWVLYAASIHGGAAMISRLHHQIQEWPQNSRGAIAAEAVQALALNPQPQALLIVDGIARKFKFKQVRAAAGQALEFAAGQLGLTREQLEDKIVPSLGFDENMERRFDYGSRSFTVTITPALEVEVFDEGGRKLKNMPAPGARDDEEKAAAAYAEFKEMKKQMKATVTSQKQRLELALSAERLWTAAAWRDLFVGNPIMHQFAIGLVWGVYEEHKLTQSFRYMEDGSFNTEDEEEYSLPEQGTIGLVHPIELSEESLKTWKQQLEDYEIAQPIEQLDRAIYYITPQEQQSKSLERFGGMMLNDLSLGGKLTALGWYRGSVMDGGGFNTYYREDPSLGLGAELHFSGSYVGSGSMGGEEITVYDVRFYRAGAVDRTAYSYDEAKGDKQLPLKDIPPRYFSEIVWQMTKATVSSKEKDENWKKDM